jgi:hypothetical protein
VGGAAAAGLSNRVRVADGGGSGRRRAAAPCLRGQRVPQPRRSRALRVPASQRRRLRRARGGVAAARPVDAADAEDAGDGADP